jgi:hypothetical protein
MALIVEFSSKEKKKQKVLLPKEKTTSFKKIQKDKSTFIYLTVLVSADIKLQNLWSISVFDRTVSSFCFRKREQ